MKLAFICLNVVIRTLPFECCSVFGRSVWASSWIWLLKIDKPYSADHFYRLLCCSKLERNNSSWYCPKDSAKYTLSAPPHLTGCLVAVRCNEEHLRLPSGCPTTSLGRHHSIRLKTCLLPKHLQGAREGNENCSILKIECNSTLLLKN